MNVVYKATLYQVVALKGYALMSYLISDSINQSSQGFQLNVSRRIKSYTRFPIQIWIFFMVMVSRKYQIKNNKILVGYHILAKCPEKILDTITLLARVIDRDV